MLGTRDGGRGSGVRGRKSGKDSSQGTGVSDQEKTEVRSQKSEGGGQMSKVGNHGMDIETKRIKSCALLSADDDAHP